MTYEHVSMLCTRCACEPALHSRPQSIAESNAAMRNTAMQQDRLVFLASFSKRTSNFFLCSERRIIYIYIYKLAFCLVTFRMELRLLEGNCVCTQVLGRNTLVNLS